MNCSNCICSYKVSKNFSTSKWYSYQNKVWLNIYGKAEFCNLCSYLKVPPASFSLFFWAGVKAAAPTCLETGSISGFTGTGRDMKSQYKLQIIQTNTHIYIIYAQTEGVIRLTSSPGCSSLSWICCCPSMMRAGDWFLRVTTGVVGKVTWGLNSALCCWGWRTYNSFNSFMHIM